MPQNRQGRNARERARMLGDETRAETRSVGPLSAARTEGNKHVIFVLGMHRSGTSAMTRLLSMFGDASLPRRLLGPAHGNPYGHWESLDTLEMNDAFMLNYASAAYDPGFRVQLRSVVSPDDANAFEMRIGEFLEENFAATDLLVVKDPRITSLADFWLQAAVARGYKVGAVFMFRHPQRVAASLYDRDQLPREHANALWLKYNLIGERASRFVRRAFVEFEQLQHDWHSTLDRVNTTLELNFVLNAEKRQLIDQFLEHGGRRQVQGQDPRTERWSPIVYGWLRAAAEDPAQDVGAMDKCFDEVVSSEAMYRVAYESYTGRFQPKVTPTLIRQELRQQSEQLDLYEKILLGDLPETAHHLRIMEKVKMSISASSDALPEDFNPLRYVTRNRDLFDSEVDPFQHYLHHGRREERKWTTPREALPLSTALQAMNTLLSRYEAILHGDTEIAEKFKRIRRKVESSPHRGSSQIPDGFRPLRYACRHPDLFEAEVDPFEHYVVFGVNEGRNWNVIDSLPDDED